MTEYKFKIKGMNCQSCASLIEEELKGLSEITSAKVDFKKAELTLLANSPLDEEKIQKAVAGLGNYQITQ